MWDFLISIKNRILVVLSIFIKYVKYFYKIIYVIIYRYFFFKDLSNFISFRNFYKLYKFCNSNNMLITNFNNKFIWYTVYVYLFYNNSKDSFKVCYSDVNKYWHEANYKNKKTISLKTYESSYNLVFLSLLFFNKTKPLVSLNLLSNNNIYKIPKVDKYSKLYFFEWFYKKPKSIMFPKNKKNKSLDEKSFKFIFKNFSNKVLKYVNLGIIFNKKDFLLKYINYELIKNKISSKFLINFSPINISKYINYNNYDIEMYFLRKNKIFNKGRYSRNRQNYRTGVYMCLYVSVLSLYGIYYAFYKFSFNFSYLWLFFLLFISSFFLPKIIKYRLYEPYNIYFKFCELFKWFVSCLSRFFKK